MGNDEAEKEAAVAQVVSIPSTLKAVIKFGYDEGLKNALGDEDFDEWIEKVFTHTQGHFRHSASLGTSIEFEVQGNALYKESTFWTADENLDDATTATNEANLDGVDTMSWWCNDGGGTVAGIAFVGTLCSSYNTNLNEKRGSLAASGFVLAHELGHNFGMLHDFDEIHGGDNGPCNGQGIMSYGSYDYNQWSTCSRSDWESHYSSRGWGNGCLEDISGGDCKNRNNHCSYWQKMGYCTGEHETYMFNNCKKACGKCSDTPGCSDTYEDDCSKYLWACTNQGVFAWFKDKCQKSCGICKE